MLSMESTASVCADFPEDCAMPRLRFRADDGALGCRDDATRLAEPPALL